MNNYCLRNWRLVKTGIHSFKNYFELNGWPFFDSSADQFVPIFQSWISDKDKIWTVHGIIARKSNNNKRTLWSEIEESFITLSQTVCSWFYYSWCSVETIDTTSVEVFVLYCETSKAYHLLLVTISLMLLLDGIIFYLEWLFISTIL